MKKQHRSGHVPTIVTKMARLFDPLHVLKIAKGSGDLTERDLAATSCRNEFEARSPNAKSHAPTLQTSPANADNVNMEKKTAQTCISSAHRTAEAIVRQRTDLSEAEQDALYGRIFIGLLEDNVGSMDITELLDALSRP